MRLTKIDRILSADGDFQPVVAKMRDLRALAELVGSFLSAELAREVRVGNLKDGKLVLIATHSAAAAKLRLLAPALTRFLLDRRTQVNSVSVRVQPNKARGSLPVEKKSVQFSTHALKALRTLHERMSPSPARDALAKMLRRHGGFRKN
ncbi:MAG TPA: DciA family protein [Burkholderiales bacterium]